ncbi:hypothetical protein [Moorena sp. SIO3I8]|uniref:hypothetical protein n=1 Tax=Moorena sp. SIO3I8 TaxID=2607833 RepID=UPI0025E5824A|nr:hypothetical protein [Moorena sp. SIO3I8]
MKIAVIGAKGVPVKQGGIERYCTELYPRIVAQGHSVDLFARSSYKTGTDAIVGAAAAAAAAVAQ